MSPLIGAVASVLAGLMTAVGALLVFFLKRLPPRWEDALLAMAAGIMLAASFFSLILPGIEGAEALGHSRVAAVGQVIAGIVLGVLGIAFIHDRLPHEHFTLGQEGQSSPALSRIWLFVIAITLHNIPEGMAVGVGFAGAGFDGGVTLAVGIGVQNVPEGLAVAGALRAVGYRPAFSFLVSTATGLLEGVGGLMGALVAWLAEPLLPGILGLAAGAMLYVINDEIIPETQRRGHRRTATFSLLAGLVVMMFLDATLG